MPRITNKNYLICWSGPGAYSHDPNVFGMKVDAMRQNVDVASHGPLYRYTSGEGYERMDYEPAGFGSLRCTDGCCWVGWPGDASRTEHEKALLLLAIKVMSEDIPAKLVLKEFSKIPAFRSMKARLPCDFLGDLVT